MKSNQRRSPAVALAAASLVLLTGACGSNGQADALPPAEFATRVNAICEAEHAQVDELFADFPEEPTPDQVKGLVSDFLPIIRQFRDDVTEVGPPSGREDLYADYVELLDEAVSRYQAASSDASKAEALFADDDQRLPEMERRLGLDVCASR